MPHSLNKRQADTVSDRNRAVPEQPGYSPREETRQVQALEQVEVGIVRWQENAAQDTQDCVAVEQPLEIVVNCRSLAVTMRTPGDDFALAAGFLYAESVVKERQDIAHMRYVGAKTNPNRQNTLHVRLRPTVDFKTEEARLQRNFVATSSCGMCGKASLAATQCLAPPLEDTAFMVSPAVIRTLNARMREAQSVFDRTGGLHAAGLYDASGNLLSLHEDVGRHNALDKLVGEEFLAGRVPLNQRLLLVSGRSSFEILQKAAMARIPIVCAVSAPSSLAVQLARDLNITLVGFLRGDTMNVYSGAHRIQL